VTALREQALIALGMTENEGPGWLGHPHAENEGPGRLGHPLGSA
jgi:hypothetical protein